AYSHGAVLHGAEACGGAHGPPASPSRRRAGSAHPDATRCRATCRSCRRKCLAPARVGTQEPVNGHHPHLTARCLPTAWVIRPATIFSCCLTIICRQITEAPISAHAPADGMRRKCWWLFAWARRPIGSRVRCERPRPGHGVDPRQPPRVPCFNIGSPVGCAG